MIQDGKKLTPVELKSGRTTSGHFFSGLTYWNELVGQEKSNGYVVFAGSQKQSLGYPNIVSWQSVDKIFN